MMIKQALLATVAAVTMAAITPAIAAEEAGHAHKPGEAAHGSEKDHGHADKSHYEKKSFNTVQEAWTFLTTNASEAEKLIADKNFEPVHQIGEQLDGAIHTLEEKSDMLTPENKTKLGVLLKQLEKASDELHHASEKKDEAGMSMSVKKIKGLLPVVSGLYPQGTL